jgi:predicted acyltransferase
MANLLIVAGLAWDLTFPINKPLWTSSYVLYSMCYFLIDVKKWQTGTLPMVVFGRNPIVAFSSSVLVAKLMARIQIGELNMKTWVYENLFASWLNPLNASLLAALVGVWLFYVPIWVMYKRGIIVKV